MRTIVVAYCAMLALASQQRTPDAYAVAIDKYVAGDPDGAVDALAPVSQADIQRAVETSVAAARSEGTGTAARRRLEAIAMLHTEYAVVGAANPKEALFHVDMAHRSLAVSRDTVANQASGAAEGDRRRAREFLPHWYALAASASLSFYADQNALTLVDEGLKLFPEDRTLQFWRGLVLEFHAVWAGTPPADTHAAMQAMQNKDPSGFDLLANTRVWAPVEEAYRRIIQRDANDAAAHLHLGYALHSLRRYGDAKPEYELARDRSTDAFVVYVADLLLAKLSEDQNHLKDAVPYYEHAITKMSGAQSAYVGLGSVEARLGDAQRAREVTEHLAAIPQAQRVRDPWWAFHTTRIPSDDLSWLRTAVRQ
jgi:tetratricopeptide (TPR) repeat protein